MGSRHRLCEPVAQSAQELRVGIPNELLEPPLARGTPFDVPLDVAVTRATQAFGQQQLDVPETETERVVETDRVADDLGREAVTVVWIRDAFHPATMPQPNTRRHPIQLR